MKQIYKCTSRSSRKQRDVNNFCKEYENTNDDYRYFTVHLNDEELVYAKLKYGNSIKFYKLIGYGLYSNEAV